MARPLAAVLAAAALAAVSAPGAAAGERSPVVAVPGLGLQALDELAREGAVGLVVPDAGPSTSERRALAALERGEVVNSLRDRPPQGPALVDVDVAASVPAAAGVVVGVPRGGTQANDRRYAVLLRGERGLLTSSSTRIPGIVSIADAARARLRVVPHGDPAGELRALDARIRDNGRARPVAAVLAALLLAVLALARPRAALLGFATLLLGNLALGLGGVSEPWLVVVLLGAAVLAAVPLAAVARSPAATGAVLAASVAAYLVSMGADAAPVALSPLGPTQNARFYGLSNLLETVLLVPALAGAALLARRWGLVALAAVATVALVTVAGSRFGADGGGAIVLAAGYAVLGAALAGGGRRAGAVAAAAGAGAVALLALDALLGPATHVGESLRGGPDELLADLWERVELSWARATDSAGVAVAVGGSLVALAVLVARGVRRALPLAVAASVAVSLVVNDSPKEVAVGGLVAYLAAERAAREEEGAKLESEAPLPRRQRNP